MSGRQQLEELSEQLQALEQQLEVLDAEVQSLENEQEEIDEAVEAIETLETGSTVQVPLGGGAFVRAEVQAMDQVIVELGGGYAAEREQTDAISTLESKREAVGERIEGTEAEIADLEDTRDEIEGRAQQLQQQQLQQQMQQMQGGDGE